MLKDGEIVSISFPNKKKLKEWRKYAEKKGGLSKLVRDSLEEFIGSRNE